MAKAEEFRDLIDRWTSATTTSPPVELEKVTTANSNPQNSSSAQRNLPYSDEDKQIFSEVTAKAIK